MTQHTLSRRALAHMTQHTLSRRALAHMTQHTLSHTPKGVLTMMLSSSPDGVTGSVESNPDGCYDGG